METLQIDLPESMKSLVESCAAEGGFGSVGEYVRELIRSDLERKERERIDALLIEGLNSGPPIPGTPEFWEERRRRLIADLGLVSEDR